MKKIRIKEHLTIVFNDGTKSVIDNCTDELYNAIQDAGEDEEIVKGIIDPEYKKQLDIQNMCKTSKYVTQEGMSLYIRSISQLTLPIDFARELLEAEHSHNEDKLHAYLNFWTLLSLNPDSRVRTNLFWFMNRWGMTLSKSGLIVGYRNVDIKREGTTYNTALISFVSYQYMQVKNSKENPSNVYVIMDDSRVNEYKITTDVDKYVNLGYLVLGNLEDLYLNIVKSSGSKTTVYTDNHSHTFEIRLGHIVSMDRTKCDSNQDHTCSTGLHVGAKGWLEQNYFGKVGLKVLVNPADVVGIPPLDNYGKMRTCAYYPISVIKFKEGHVEDDGIESGFEDDFIGKICYSGEVNNEDLDNYKLEMPNIVELNRETVFKNLKKIAESINHKV